VRQLAVEDLDELYALQRANQQHLAPWMPWAEQLECDGTSAFLMEARQQAARGDGVQCAITQSGRIVGVIGFHHVNRAHLATSIGYCPAADSQGRGTMTLALSALVEHAFGASGLHRVELRAAVGNARSMAVAERLGFVHEGVLREAERLLAEEVARLAAAEGVSVTTRTLARFAPVEFDPATIDLVGATAQRLGHSTRRMPSGAGHDAQMLARICPAAMIFTPSVGGLSHNIAEYTHPTDVAAGADVLLHALLALAQPVL